MDQPNQDIVLITDEELPLGSLASRVVCPTAGAISTFIGTTRDNFEGKSVVRLEYEAYKPMAEKEILTLILQARQKWNLRHIAIAHRIGVVPTTHSSVEIAISSAHRKESLEAVHWAIDELKAKVPIWKKEVYAGGDKAAWKENKESAAPTLETLTRQEEEKALKKRAAKAALKIQLGIAAVVAVIALVQNYTKKDEL